MRSGVKQGRGDRQREGRDVLCFHREASKCTRGDAVVRLDVKRFLEDHPEATFFATIPTHKGQQRDGLKTYGLPAPEECGKEHSYIPAEYFTILEPTIARVESE